MKKADNFDASKWLTENKITTQSRLNEMATMIKKNSSFGSEKPLQVGDTIMWKTYSNDDRGMGSSISGRLIGKVVKILGTANLQAEDIKTGDLYKVSRTELTRVPNVGDKIEATLSYNFGAGSGSQGSNKISGIVKKVNPEKFSMIIQTENSDKPSIIDLKDLSDVKIYGLDESRLNEEEGTDILSFLKSNKQELLKKLATKFEDKNLLYADIIKSEADAEGNYDAEIARLDMGGLDFSFNLMKVRDKQGDVSNFKLVIAGEPVYGFSEKYYNRKGLDKPTQM